MACTAGFYTVLIGISFSFGFYARQEYCSHFEPSQSLGWAKTGDPQEQKLIENLHWLMIRPKQKIYVCVSGFRLNKTRYGRSEIDFILSNYFIQ